MSGADIAAPMSPTILCRNSFSFASSKGIDPLLVTRTPCKAPSIAAANAGRIHCNFLNRCDSGRERRTFGRPSGRYAIFVDHTGTRR
jgi:hypothetical protein